MKRLAILVGINIAVFILASLVMFVLVEAIAMSIMEVHYPRQSCGELIPEFVIDLDEYGRRVVVESQGDRPKHLLLFGGSYVEGYGVENTQTLAYELIQKLPEYDTYVYARSGWGPQHALWRLTTEDIPSQVPQHEGVAVYVFVDFHLGRSVAGWFTGNWLTGSPRYVFDDNEGVLYTGTFDEMEPIRSQLKKALMFCLKYSFFLKTIPVEITATSSDRAVELSCRILNDARKAYESAFDGDFIVLMHPFSIDKKANEKVMRSLQEKGVTVIAPRLLPDEKACQQYAVSPTDGHPNGAINKLIADDLQAYFEAVS